MSLLFGIDIYTHLKGNYQNLIAVTPQLILPINWLPRGRIYNFFSRLNDHIVYQTIQRVIADFKVSKFIFINSFNPLIGEFFPKGFRPYLKIYHAVDDISQSVYVSKHGVYKEKITIENSDLTITTSLELFKLKSNYTKNVYYLPNAADIELFKKAHLENIAKPKEIVGVEGPIVLFTGNMDIRLNYNLLYGAFKAHADKSFVFVGPVNSKACKEFSNLSNVHFIGFKKLEELPAFLKHATITIIPFKCNKLTKSIYPLKLNEYLAAGKPIVSTAFSKDVVKFKSAIYLSSSKSEFIQKIQLAIVEDNEERRRKRVKVAEKNTWKARVSTFWNILENHEQKN